MGGKRERPWQRWYPDGVSAEFDPPPATLPEMFLNLVARHGPRVAIDYYGTTITYRELGRRAELLATALRRRGVGKGDTVALYLPNCPWHPVFFFASLLAGARVTHLSPLDAVAELEHKLADSGASLLVTLSASAFLGNARLLRARGTAAHVVLCDDPVAGPPGEIADSEDFILCEQLLAEETGSPVSSAAAPDDIALLQYTGGTTGTPKAATLTHRNMSAAVLIYEEWFRVDRQVEHEPVVLLYSPLFHILGLVTNLLRRLHSGARIVLKQRFDVAEAIAEIESKRVTSLSGVPTMWIALANFPGIETRDLSSLVYISSGGAALPDGVFRRVNELTGLVLRGGWGMTETAAAGTNLPQDFPEEKVGTIGVPLPGIEVEIVAVDDPRRVLPPGEAGEMRVRGPNVAAGYWNHQEESEAAFVDGWLLTGDIAVMDADGFFRLVDRKKDMIVSAGFNVYPQVIENAILSHPDVAEVLVVGVPDDYRGEATKACVVLRPGAETFTLEELCAFLRDRLGRHEMPRHLEFRIELPRTSVGKYSRKMLRDQEAGGGR